MARETTTATTNGVQLKSPFLPGTSRGGLDIANKVGVILLFKVTSCVVSLFDGWVVTITESTKKDRTDSLLTISQFRTLSFLQNTVPRRTLW